MSTSCPPSQPQHILQTRPRQVDVRPAGPAGLLLEGVEDVDTLFELCDVDHAVLKPCMNTDLPYARADQGHRLPVGRLQATLDLVELVPCTLSSILRKGAYVLSSDSHPQDRPHHPCI